MLESTFNGNRTEKRSACVYRRKSHCHLSLKRLCRQQWRRLPFSTLALCQETSRHMVFLHANDLIQVDRDRTDWIQTSKFERNPLTFSRSINFASLSKLKLPLYLNETENGEHCMLRDWMPIQKKPFSIRIEAWARRTDE